MISDKKPWVKWYNKNKNGTDKKFSELSEVRRKGIEIMYKNRRLMKRLSNK